MKCSTRVLPPRADCAVYKAQEANTNPADPLLYRATKYFILALLGLGIAGTAFGVNIGVENIAGFKFWLTFQAFGYVTRSHRWICKIVLCVGYVGQCTLQWMAAVVSHAESPGGKRAQPGGHLPEKNCKVSP